MDLVLGALHALMLLAVVLVMYFVARAVRRYELLIQDKQRDRLLYRAAQFGEECQRKALREQGLVIDGVKKLELAAEFYARRLRSRGLSSMGDAVLEDIESVLPAVRQHYETTRGEEYARTRKVRAAPGR